MKIVILTQSPQIQVDDPQRSAIDPIEEDKDASSDVRFPPSLAVVGVSVDSTVQRDSWASEGTTVEQFEAIGNDIEAELFVSLDLDLDIRVFRPTRIIEHRKRLLIYSVVSFHLGLYAGLVLFPVFSKALRNFVK